jgi:hypothetical protein
MDKPVKEKISRVRFLSQEEYDLMVLLLQGQTVSVSAAFRRLSTTCKWQGGKLFKSVKKQGSSLLFHYIPPSEKIAVIKHYHEDICSHSGWHRTHAAVSK